jgi:hypothetical protein
LIFGVGFKAAGAAVFLRNFTFYATFSGSATIVGCFQGGKRGVPSAFVTKR